MMRFSPDSRITTGTWVAKGPVSVLETRMVNGFARMKSRAAARSSLRKCSGIYTRFYCLFLADSKSCTQRALRFTKDFCCFRLQRLLFLFINPAIFPANIEQLIDLGD